MPEQRKQSPEQKTPTEEGKNKLQIPFVTAYGPKRHAPLSFPEKGGRTRQEFRAECDINVIMRRYQQTGVLEFTNKREAQYADVTGHDYQTAMDLVANARTAFEELPSSIRARFNNDPGELLDFVHDPESYDEAVELGLLKPEAVKAYKQGIADQKAGAVPARSTAGAEPAQSNPPGAAAELNLGDPGKPAQAKK